MHDVTNSLNSEGIECAMAGNLRPDTAGSSI